MAILKNTWSWGENIFVMIKTCSRNKKLKFLNFKCVSSIPGCLKETIDFNDAWNRDESMRNVKQASANLNAVLFQSRHSRKSVKLTEIQLNQCTMSLDCNIWPAITLALFFFFSDCLSISVSISLSYSPNTSLSWLSLLLSHLLLTPRPSAPSHLPLLLS